MAEGPGSDDGVLNRLRQQSAELGKVAVMGTYDYNVSPALGVLTLRRLQEQLKQQKCNLQNRIITGGNSMDEKELEYIAEDYLKGACKQLVEEIDGLKVSYRTKSLALQRTQMYDVLYQKVTVESKESDVLKKIMKHSLAVSSLLLKEDKEVLALEKELTEIRKKRMTLKHKNKAMMSELQTLVDEQRTLRAPKQDKLKQIFRYIKRETDTITVLQNIFQRLVLASNVNWAANPKLREAVLKAGKNVSDL